MPIYEYTCNGCEATFEALVRSSNDQPRCPKCGETDLNKEFSAPAAARVQGGSSALPVCPPSAMPPGACGGPACRSGLCGDM
ncbi:MAG: FmdB family zinc ribbon protein [bacterium]